MLFRCLFLKFSMQKKIPSGIKSSSFFNMFFTICHGILFYNFCSFFSIAYENHVGNRTTFILYHACYDPNKKYSSSLYAAMPLRNAFHINSTDQRLVNNSLLLFMKGNHFSTFFAMSTHIVHVAGNFYLYRCLQSYTDKREGNFSHKSKS